jgi:AcrR family transcriptional regulator
MTRATSRNASDSRPGEGARRRHRSRRARIAAAPTGAALPRRLAPRKEPRQERARETVEAILRAAIHVFATHGYAGTTTNLVAERAGVSVGSLYQYFPHKNAILAALHQRHTAPVAEVVAHAVARFADPSMSLERGFRELIAELHRIHDADPELTRVVSEMAPQVPGLELKLRQNEEASAAAVEAILRARPEVRAGDRRVMAHVLTQAAESMTRWLQHDLPPGLDRGTATEEVARLLTDYLLGCARQAIGPGQSERGRGARHQTQRSESLPESVIARRPAGV